MSDSTRGLAARGISYLRDIKHSRHNQLHAVIEAHCFEQSWRVIDLAKKEH